MFTEEEIEEMKQGSYPKAQKVSATQPQADASADLLNDLYRMVYELYQLKPIIEDIGRRISRIEYKLTYLYKAQGGDASEVAKPVPQAFVPQPPRSPVVELGGSVAQFR